MAKFMKLANVGVYRHDFQDKQVYATRCQDKQLENVMSELYEMYHKVEMTVYRYGYSYLNPYEVYAEITCM